MLVFIYCWLFQNRADRCVKLTRVGLVLKWLKTFPCMENVVHLFKKQSPVAVLFSFLLQCQWTSSSLCPLLQNIHVGI